MVDVVVFTGVMVDVVVFTSSGRRGSIYRGTGRRVVFTGVAVDVVVFTGLPLDL